MDLFEIFGKITLEGVQAVEKSLTDLEKKYKDNAAGLKVLGGAFAALGAAMVAATGYAIKSAVEVEGTKTAFQNLAKAAGQSGEDILRAMQKASSGTISEANLMRSATRAMTMGVASDIEEFTSLMEIARLRGSEMGISTAEAFDVLSDGIGRLSPLMLKQLGIVIDTTDAYTRYATSIGKTKDELTEAEKKQALYNEILSKNSDALGSSGDVAMTAKESMEALKASFDDLMSVIGEMFLPAIKEIATRITTVVKAVKEWMDKNPELVDGLKAAGIALGIIVGTVVTLNVLMPLLAGGIRAVGAAFRAALGPVGWILMALEAIVALIIANWDKIVGWFKNLFGIKDDAKKATEAVAELTEATEDFSEAAQEAAARSEEEQKALERLIDQVRKLSVAYEYGETAAGRYGLTFDSVTKYLLAQGYSIKELTELVEKYGDDVNAILAAVGRDAREVAKALEITTDKMMSNMQRYTKDAKSAAEDRYRAEKAGLDTLSREYKDAYNARIGMINDELAARIRAIDEELSLTVEGYQSRIKALEDEQKGEDRARKEAEDRQKLEFLQSQMRLERDLDKRAELQEQYNKLLQDIDERHRKESRDDEKVFLQEQISEARKAASVAKDDAKTDAEEQKAAAKDKLDLQLETNAAIDAANQTLLEAELARYDANLLAFENFLDDKLRSTSEYVKEYNRLMAGLGQEQVVDPSQRYRTDADRLQAMGLDSSRILNNPVRLPELASGGDILRGGLALVGERGPEILDLPTGSRVTPLSGANPGDITIQINNPVVRSEQDINDLATKVGRVLNREYRQARRLRGIS